MELVLIAGILMVVAAAWALHLVRLLRDWRLLVLPIFLLVPGVGQIAASFHLDRLEEIRAADGSQLITPLASLIVLFVFDRFVAHSNKTQDALRWKEALLSSVMNAAPLGFLVIDDDSGKILFANRRFCHLWRLGAHENRIIDGDMSYDDLVPLCRPQVADTKVFDEGCGPLASADPSYVKEDGVRFVDGRTLRRFLAQVKTNEGGALGRLCVFEDITRLKRAEQDLRATRDSLQVRVRQRTAEAARFRAVMDQADESIFITDPSTQRYVDVNETACRELGYTRDELLQMGPADVVVDYPLHSDQEWSAHVRKLKGRKRPLRVTEMRHRRKDGSTFAAEASVSRRLFQGRAYHLVVVNNLTQRRKLEAELRQAQKLEAIGVLAGGIAHDFNNILTSILGFARLAADEVGPNSPQQPHLREVLRAAERARELVMQILVFGRRGEQQARTVDLAVILREALRLLRAIVPSTIEIQVEIEPACGRVLADATQLHQVVINLCTNAYQAMKESGGVMGLQLDCLEVEEGDSHLHPDLQAGRYARLRVSDTGPGIDAADQHRIFEPFFTTKNVGEGTGLGLSVAHGIVTSHGGTIRVESEPGKGAVFTVYLPRADGAEGDTPPFAEANPRGDEHILFVDDEEPILWLGRRMLVGLGYTVTARSGGRAALRAFRESPEAYDLVVSDVTMPKMNGVDLARELLAIRPSIPIILTTGYSDLITAESAQEMGVEALLAKPYERPALAVAVRRALDRAQGDTA